MPSERPVLTGYAQSAHGNQQPDFNQGRPCRPVQTHDEAAGGGNRTLQRPSGKRPALAREKESISTVGHREHVQGSSSRRIQWLAPCCKAQNAMQEPWQSPQTRGTATALAVAPSGEAESHSCKSTLASLPRELMPNPSLKRSANGRPPGPFCGAEHFPQPGPGVLPSSPA